MLLRDRVDSFNKLSKILANSTNDKSIDSTLEKVEKNNSWFVREHVQFSFRAISFMLSDDKLEQWIYNYQLKTSVKKIGVIIPSNIPLVGFYDFLCVLLSGNIFIGKLSISNNILLPFIAELLYSINKDFKKYIFFQNDLTDIDLLIATGDDNSSEYFNYFFKSIPKIIRRNRNSICVLDGSETKDDYRSLMNDLLMYYGLGCRNVSKLYIPIQLNINILQSHIKNFFKSKISNNYLDNYLFQKTKHTLNKIDFLDCGHTLLTPSKYISSPISVIYYESYNNLSVVKKHLKDNCNIIQCVVSNSIVFDRMSSFGKSQMPDLKDKPDGVDIIQFICSH